MLKHHTESIASYLWSLAPDDFRVETRPNVRRDELNKYAKIPFLRFFLAVNFILKDDAFIRPYKPDTSKSMFYRKGLWKVHNCGQRKDGTFYTSGNATLILLENGKEPFDSSQSDLPYSGIKSRFEAAKKTLRNESGGEDLPRKS